LPDIEEVVDFPPFSPMNYEPAGFGSSGNAFTLGTTLTAASSANTKGSWTQLIASTTNPVVGILVLLEVSSLATFLIDIGTGASGSEVVLIPDIYASFYSTNAAIMSAAIFFPVQVPAGTRIAARCQSGTANSTVYVALSLMESQ
jgi:hypothetical protein